MNVIGFRILAGSQLQSLLVAMQLIKDTINEIQKQWKKEKSAIIPNTKALQCFVCYQLTITNQSTEFNVESGAKKGEISRAFKKMLGCKSTNKKLLNSFVEYVS